MVQFRAKLGEKEYPIEVSTDAKIIEAKMQLEKSSGGELQASQQKWIYQVIILRRARTAWLTCGRVVGEDPQRRRHGGLNRDPGRTRRARAEDSVSRRPRLYSAGRRSRLCSAGCSPRGGRNGPGARGILAAIRPGNGETAH